MNGRVLYLRLVVFFFSSRRRHTRFDCDWSSDVCSSDLRSDADQGAYGQRREERGFGARGHDAKVVGALLGSLARHLGDQWRGGEPERDGDARLGQNTGPQRQGRLGTEPVGPQGGGLINGMLLDERDRKSTRLNSSHSQISYAVFCL